MSSHVGNRVDLSDGEPVDGPERGARGSLGMSAASWTMQSPCSVERSAACPCVRLAL